MQYLTTNAKTNSLEHLFVRIIDCILSCFILPTIVGKSYVYHCSFLTIRPLDQQPTVLYIRG